MGGNSSRGNVDGSLLIKRQLKSSLSPARLKRTGDVISFLSFMNQASRTILHIPHTFVNYVLVWDTGRLVPRECCE